MPAFPMSCQHALSWQQAKAYLDASLKHAGMTWEKLV